MFLLSRLDPRRYGRPPAATAWTNREGELIDTIAETADLFDGYLDNLRDLPPDATEDVGSEANAERDAQATARGTGE